MHCISSLGRLGFSSGDWEEISANLWSRLDKGFSLPIKKKKKSNAGNREEELFTIVQSSSILISLRFLWIALIEVFRGKNIYFYTLAISKGKLEKNAHTNFLTR